MLKTVDSPRMSEAEFIVGAPGVVWIGVLPLNTFAGVPEPLLKTMSVVPSLTAMDSHQRLVADYCSSD